MSQVEHPNSDIAMVFGKGLNKIFPGGNGFLPKIMFAAFSPIIRVAAFVFAAGIVGMIETSATRMPSSPCTRN